MHDCMYACRRSHIGNSYYNYYSLSQGPFGFWVWWPLSSEAWVVLIKPRKIRCAPVSLRKYERAHSGEVTTKGTSEPSIGGARSALGV